MIKAIPRVKASSRVIFLYRSVNHSYKLNSNKHILPKVRIIINLFLNSAAGMTIVARLKIIRKSTRCTKVTKVRVCKFMKHLTITISASNNQNYSLLTINNIRITNKKKLNKINKNQPFSKIMIPKTKTR